MERDDFAQCTNGEEGQKATGEKASVSRRDFLKLAAVSGATVGIGAGLGGLIAACGEAETTTTSATGGSATTATTSGVTTTAGETTTSASAGTETGREIKVGIPSPYTGPYALFGIADKYSSNVGTS